MLIALLLSLTLDGPTAADVPPPPERPAAATSLSSAAQPNTAEETTSQQIVLTPPPSSIADEGSRDPFGAMRFRWREHPEIRAGRNFRLAFVGKFQGDGRHFGDDPDPTANPTWQVQRLRFGVEGEVFRHIQFQVEHEFTERKVTKPGRNQKTEWKDVYAEVDYIQRAQIRGGRFKIPFGMDENNSEMELDFVERSGIGDYIQPGRDTGAEVHGRFFKRGLNYWAGVFQGDGDNSQSSKIVGADTTGAVRVNAAVFRKTGLSWLTDTLVGGAFAISSLSDKSLLPNGLRARTVLSQYDWWEPMFVKGTRARYGAEFDWAHGPFGSRAEYNQVNDTRDEQGFGNENLNDVVARGWYVDGTWLLTGDKKTRPVIPKRPLLRGGIGAIEIGARYDELGFSGKPGADEPFRNPRAETIYPNKNKVFTVGANWYPNRWVKIQVNGIHETQDDPERSPTGGVPFWSSVVRFQAEF